MQYERFTTEERVALQAMTAMKFMNKVEGMFKGDCSPEQIAGRLKTENPERPEERVSAETVYRYVYGKMAGGEGLSGHFRQGYKKGKRRTGRKDGRGQIRDKTTIEERPGEAVI